MNLSSLSNEALVKLLEHPNIWQRRMAQRLLSERSSVDPAPLKALTTGGKALETRLAAFWTLHSCRLLDEETLSTLAHDTEPPIRAWVARFTGERHVDSEAAIARLETLAADSDPTVR